MVAGYRYKLYKTDRTKHLDAMLREACFVWNHALALQKRYHRLYGGYVRKERMQNFFSQKRNRTKHVYNNVLLDAQTVQEVLERQAEAYDRFFKHLAKRPPKFRKAADFKSIVFKQTGYKLYGNEVVINKISKRYKFSFSRPYDGGKVKRIQIKRNGLGEYFLIVSLEKSGERIGKSHDGASVGIDFGLKTYMTLSNGTEIQNPRFLKADMAELKRRSRDFSRCEKGSNNRSRRKRELAKLHDDIKNRRDAWQWELAHELCRKYDLICVEDLELTGMSRLWGRKMADLGHAEFIRKLEHLSHKYGVTVHKIDRYWPSSRTCACGHVNEELTLSDRVWTCPECGAVHRRDLLAAQNILRRGIAELGSTRKTGTLPARCVSTQESPGL